MSDARHQPAAFTVDVEDWFHPELVRDRVANGDARSVVQSGTTTLLDVLRRHSTRATFFLLGDVITNHAELVRRIADEGHEIACHGMTHRPLWKLDRESFRQELRDFRSALRDVLGSDPAIGFRAPTFSLDHSTAWALDVLHEEGFKYDSSIFPQRVKLYGVAGAPLGIYRPSRDDLARHDPEGPVVEFPVAVGALGPVRLPVAGGFYLRTLPLWVTTSVLDSIRRDRPFVLYLHPWEGASDLPRVRLSATDSLITYLNLHTVLSKVDHLLGRYEFMTMREILESQGHLAPTPH